MNIKKIIGFLTAMAMSLSVLISSVSAEDIVNDKNTEEVQQDELVYEVLPDELAEQAKEDSELADAILQDPEYVKRLREYEEDPELYIINRDNDDPTTVSVRAKNGAILTESSRRVYATPTATTTYTPNMTLYHMSQFDDSRYEYVIDVSQYQGNIDWKKVKAAGISYAILRAGYRGWGSAGYVYEDNYYAQNIINAKAAGVKIGAYFYTTAITAAEAEYEAKCCINWTNNVAGYTVDDLDMPILFDLEDTNMGDGNHRDDSVHKSKYWNTVLSDAFCQYLEKRNIDAGIYSYYGYMLGYCDCTYLTNRYYIFLACYNNYVYSGFSNYKFHFWQFSSNQYVNGISGRVDMNVWYVDKTNFKCQRSEAPKVGKLENLSYTMKNKSTAILAWSESENASKYKVYVNGELKANTSKLTANVSVSGKSVIKVVPYTTFNDKEITGTEGKLTINLTVPVVSGISATYSSDKTKATIQWTAGKGVTAYKLYTVDDAETMDNKTLVATIIDGTQFTVDVGNKSTTYALSAIKPINGYDYESDCVTFRIAYYKINDVKVTLSLDPKENILNTYKVKLNWSAIEKASSYYVYERVDDGEFVKIAEVPDPAYTFNKQYFKGKYSYRVYPVVKDKNYIYRAYSNIISLTVSKDPMLETPNVSVQHEGTTATFSWAAVPGASSYEIYKYEKDAGGFVKFNTTNKTTFTVKVSNEPFRLGVKAIGIIDNKQVTSEIGTISGGIAKITDLTATSTDLASGKIKVNLTWTMPEGVKSVSLYQNFDGKKTRLSGSEPITESSYTYQANFAVGIHELFLVPIEVEKDMKIEDSNAVTVTKAPDMGEIILEKNDFDDIIISWADVNADKYAVTYKNGKNTITKEVTGTSFTLNDFDFDTNYTFEVKAILNGKKGKASSIQVTTVSGEVEDFTVTAMGNYMYFKWSTIQDKPIKKYTVIKKVDGLWQQIGESENGECTIPYSDYAGEYNVYAYVDRNNKNSLYAKGEVLNVAPKPEKIAIDSVIITANGLQVIWLNDTGAEYYKLYNYNRKIGKYPVIASIKNTLASARIGKTIPIEKAGQEFNFKIRAGYTSPDGRSIVYSDMSTTVRYIAPFNVSATYSSIDNNTNISWNAVPNVSGYNVYCETNGVKTRINEQPVQGTSYKDTRANRPQTNAKYYVYPVIDNLEFINLRYVKIDGAPGKVTNLKVTNKTAKTVSLSWNKDSKATAYRVYIQKNGTYEKFTDVKDPNCVITGLRANTSYKFRIKPYRVNGKYSAWGLNAYISVKTTK